MPWRAILARALLAAALAAATLLLYLGIGRFDLTGPELLPPLPAQPGPSTDWQMRGEVVPDGAGGVMLHNADPAGHAVLFQRLAVPAGISHLSLSARIRLDGVHGGRDLWHRARIILPTRPAGGDAASWRYDLPHTVVRRQGSSGWTPVEEVFRLPADSEVLVSVQLLHATGSFQVRDLSLRAAVEKAWFPPAAHLLALFWLLAAFWTVWPILGPMLTRLRRGRVEGRDLRIVAVLATAVAIATAALLPSEAKQHLRFLVPTFGTLTPQAAPAADRPAMAQTAPSAAPSSAPDFLAPQRLRWLAIDKGGHVAGFALLAFLACWASRGPARGRVPTLVAVAGGLIGLAALTEVWQVMAEDRGASRADVAINLLGLGLGALVWFGLRGLTGLWHSRIAGPR